MNSREMAYIADVMETLEKKWDILDWLWSPTRGQLEGDFKDGNASIGFTLRPYVAEEDHVWTSQCTYQRLISSPNPVEIVGDAVERFDAVEAVEAARDSAITQASTAAGILGVVLA